MAELPETQELPISLLRALRDRVRWTFTQNQGVCSLPEPYADPFACMVPVRKWFPPFIDPQLP